MHIDESSPETATVSRTLTLQVHLVRKTVIREEPPQQSILRRGEVPLQMQWREAAGP